LILKQTLKDVVRSQFEEIQGLDIGIEREILSKIDFKTSHVIVLSGIRRCGKSTLLRQIMRRINAKYYFNFEDPRAVSFELHDFEKLTSVFKEEFGENRFYFFDEVQNVPQWERFVRKLQDSGNKVFITGSNASLLSRELGTLLTGRHLTYELFPFSYPEMLNLTRQKPSDNSFADYSQLGGFPEFLKYRNVEILHQLFRDIITRDIIARYQIREHKILLELAIFLLSNIGKEFSYNRIKNLFNLGSTNTAIAYTNYLEETYLIFTVPKFDFSFTKQRTHAKKVYGIDPGFLRANTASFTTDKGRILENIVFLHLKRYYPDIFYFRNKQECDFLIKKRNKLKMAIQVCYELNMDNLNRELNGLKEAMEILKIKKGLILTFNQEDRIENIPIQPVWKWILEFK